MNVLNFNRSGIAFMIMLLGTLMLSPDHRVCKANEATLTGWDLPPSSEECWKTLPQPIGSDRPTLPSWIRMIAREMPRTAAAFIELDYAQRQSGPVDHKLRAAMRWVAAEANRCQYTMKIAAYDAMQAGVSQDKWESLTIGDRAKWSPTERAALEFAYGMTRDSDGVTDELFSYLAKELGDRVVASIVLHMAYANFQDRLILCLGLEATENDLTPPVNVRFSPESLEKRTIAPSPNTPKQIGTPESKPQDLIAHGESYTWLPYEKLQERLQIQKVRKTRLRVPDWQEFASKLPDGLMPVASDIVWYKVAFGYAHELAVPFEIYMRTAGSEISTNWDRAFGNSIFWMVTDAMKCPYCMGHCEMNWEVAGFDRSKISQISQQLAENDWSNFSSHEQQALDFARRLTLSPGSITKADMDKLRAGFGDQRAFFIAVNASRYNYMTRISNGFQLTLESGNPFYQYYNMAPPKTNELAATPRPTPVHRDAMKSHLEDMKRRRERVSLPPVSDEERALSDGRNPTYESRLNRFFLGNSSSARSYLNFSGSRTPNAGSTTSPTFLEPDPMLSLDYEFKTRLFWIASRANNCQYCLGHQESKLLAVGMTDDLIAALDVNWSLFPESEQAAFALARRLTLEPQRLTDAEIDACRKHYGDMAILEMILSVAGNNAINRWKEGIGVPQSTTGGNFGASNTSEHSYLTETSPSFANRSSIVIEGNGNDSASDTVVTKWNDRKASELPSTSAGLEMVKNRTPRFAVRTEEETREAFGELSIPKNPPQWMRLLANFPVAGKRQVASILSAESDLDLSDLTRARLAWVIARQNGAWYSLSEADTKLLRMGQTREQITLLENFEQLDSEETLTARDKALLTVAKNLAASPVVLTDLEAQNAIDLAGPREFVQTVHFTAIRSLFDRFTEASNLPADRE
ncbi:carboxymuconolactone decarboxylase family protein [Pirellulaceae bacterium SH449]